MKEPSIYIRLIMVAVFGFGAAGSACQLQAEEGAIKEQVVRLYSDDSDVRSAAVSKLIEFGQASVPYIDPFRSECNQSAPIPKRCENYVVALRETIKVLESLAIHFEQKKSPGKNKAKNLLWHMVNAPGADVFLPPAYADKADFKAGKLRHEAVLSLDRLMDIPGNLKEDQVMQAALSHARYHGQAWYLLSNCAGETMNSGCNYGSYLFGTGGVLVSFRLIHYDDRDNIGFGFDTTITFDRDEPAIGVLRALGGFGGDQEKILFYRLTEKQVPLCELSTFDLNRNLFSNYRSYLVLASQGCKLVKTDPVVQFRYFPTNGNQPPSEEKIKNK